MYTITTQGTFVSDGTSRVIPVPQGIDWFRVIDYTNAAGYVANSTMRWTWYKGMGVNNAIHETSIAGSLFANTAAIVALGGNYVSTHGFTLIDSSTQLPTARVATTGSSNAAAPVVTTATTQPLEINRTVIRLSDIAATPEICGIDYTVTAINPGVSFTLPIHATAPTLGGAGYYRIISYDYTQNFYPANRTVINITQAAAAVVTTSVIHTYTVGQKVRIKVPANCGMVELNGQEVTITAVTGQTFTINVDTTGYTAFAWPHLAVFPTTLAQVVPVGEAGVLPYSNLFTDAAQNQCYSGMVLGTGVAAASVANSPAGTNGDVMYWQAGKVANL